MRFINALIIDDEPLARQIIESHLDKIPSWNIVGSCANAEEAYEALLKFDVDVIFLDIQMPKITGIDFLKSLNNPPLTILTTAFNEYAIEGYQLNVVDYLLKPILFNRFFQAIEKVNERLSKTNSDKEDKDEMNYCFFKHNGKLIKIIFDEIIYIKAEQEYSYIFTIKEKYLVSMHLKKIQAILPEDEFIRIHRSYIVSKKKISSISGNTVQIGDSISLPISKKNKPILFNRLKIKGDDK